MGEQLEKSAPVLVQGSPGPGRVLIFRGLRVRMGMATGAAPEDVQWNSALGEVPF